jgi:diketogulonate reductase-like aldo/keto reductase
MANEDLPSIPARPFGPLDKLVPMIGQGTWHMDTDDRASAIRALRAGIDAGLTHIDTAEMYGNGRVEHLIGEAIAGRRDEVFLVSKVLPQNAIARSATRSCEASLRYLHTDHLDCYLLHWMPSHPLEQAVAELERLQQSGKIRSWGVSNFDADELKEVLRLVDPSRVVCNQVLYHLQERAIEHAVLPFCEEHGIALVAYSPYGSGSFPSPASKGGKVLSEIAARHDATPRQVALAFLLRSQSVFVIPKASRPEHTLENAGAAKVVLGDADLKALDAAFPRGRPSIGIPML